MNVLLIYQVKNWGRVRPNVHTQTQICSVRVFYWKLRIKKENPLLFMFVLYLVRYVIWYVAWYISQFNICLSWSHFSSLDQWLFCCVGLIYTWKLKRNFGWKNEQNFNILVSLETWEELPSLWNTLYRTQYRIWILKIFLWIHVHKFCVPEHSVPLGCDTVLLGN
jgi:hypothetical protein